MGRDKVSTWNLILLFVIVFAIANVAFAVTMIAMGGDNRAIIKEFAMKTGIMVAFNSVLLIIADCCVMIERGRWNRKSQVDCFAGETYQLLKCSAMYYVLVASTLFLDFGLGSITVHGYLEDAQEVVEWVQSGEAAFPLCIMLFFNGYSIYAILHRCAYKVFYTRSTVGVTDFLRKKQVRRSEVKSIEYYHVSQRKREELILRTRDQKIELHSDVLRDGWMEFVNWTQVMAEQYRIPINGEGWD